MLHRFTSPSWPICRCFAQEFSSSTSHRALPDFSLSRSLNGGGYQQPRQNAREKMQKMQKKEISFGALKQWLRHKTWLGYFTRLTNADRP
jgi:hypothetical protein